MEEFGELPKIARKSWKTSKRILEENKKQNTLLSYIKKWKIIRGIANEVSNASCLDETFFKGFIARTSKRILEENKKQKNLLDYVKKVEKW